MYWQKIETAPRDGREILLAAKRSENCDVCCLGHWEPYELDQGPEGVDGRWMTIAADGAGLFELSSRGWEPTHWCRWETPETVKEVEQRVATQTRRQFAQREYNQLLRKVVQCEYHYRVRHESLVTDQEFDRMFARLSEIERSGEVEASEWSPVEKILGENESNYPEWAKGSV